MAKVPNAVEILPKIWTAWVGRTNVTDRQTTDGRATACSEREREFAKNSGHRCRAYPYSPRLYECNVAYVTVVTVIYINSIFNRLLPFCLFYPHVFNFCVYQYCLKSAEETYRRNREILLCLGTYPSGHWSLTITLYQTGWMTAA